MPGARKVGSLHARIRWDVLDRLGRLAWALMGVGLVIVAVGYVASAVGWYLIPVALAVVVGVIAAPVVGVLERRGLSRGLATALAFVGMVFVLSVALWTMVPPFVTQATRLMADVPQFLSDVAADVGTLEERLSVSDPAAAETLHGFQEGLQKRAVGVAERLPYTVFGIVNMSFGFVAAAVIGATLAFIAMKDLPTYSRVVNDWLDRPGRQRLAGALRQMGRTVAAFIRGQLLLAVIIGVMAGTALWLVGVPFPVPLGVVSMIGEMIPTVGPILAAIPAVILAVGEGGAGMAVVAVVALLIVHQVESYLIAPFVVGKVLEMRAFTVIIALTLAGGTFGIVGMVLVIPLLAVIRDGSRWFFMSDDEVRVEAAKLARR